MPLQATSGAASYDAFGGGVPVVPAYIEEVFSMWLYTGTGPSNQTITNNIDLSTKGGLVWSKNRTGPYGLSNSLIDTVRGNRYQLYSDLDFAQADLGATVTNQAIASFSTTGYVLGGDQSVGSTNSSSSYTYASWTFRKQPKFFDIQTWTGSGANRTISHSLGSVPACIMVKRTNTTGDWQVYHSSLANTEYLVLNTTAAKATGATRWNSTTPTSTVFSVGTDATVNASGGTYVAYLFASNAGGFGLTGTENAITCGSYTGTGNTNNPQTLGYEPQWLLIKNATMTQDWYMFDTMRGFPAASTSGDYYTDTPNTDTILANSSGAEVSNFHFASPTATGFTLGSAGGTPGQSQTNSAGATYIYIAIRRGPMKVPTSGTSVFGLSARTGTGANATVTGGQIDDTVLVKNRGSAVASLFSSRLTGTGYLVTSSTDAEVAAGTTILQANPWDVMDGVKVGTTSTITNASSNTYINYLFKRAPSFFDEVCYTGTGVARTVTHNLAAVPELMIVKKRNSATNSNWFVYSGALLNTQILKLNLTDAVATGTGVWNSTTPTSTVFSLGTSVFVNSSGDTFVNYLFATAAGVSKVGSYTGTATTLQIDCGFTAGARFVLIKRTDSTGDWYVWDTARGIVSGNDPYLLLNSTAAEVTGTDYVDTYNAGFELSSTAPAAINSNGGSFVFLAIA